MMYQKKTTWLEFGTAFGGFGATCLDILLYAWDWKRTHLQYGEIPIRTYGVDVDLDGALELFAALFQQFLPA
jgi:hypothetical protein